METPSKQPVTTSLSASLTPRPSPKLLAERTKILIGCYPAGKPNDPEIYTAAIASALANYPEEIVKRVTDPRTGIQRKCKFLPSVAEVIEACEEEMRPIRARWRAERMAQQVIEQHAKERSPEERARVFARFQKLSAELGTIDALKKSAAA